jgi:hypothetical protein
MSEQRALFLRKGLIGTCALFAVVLFVSFYMVVDGAVQRGARQRVASVDTATPSASPAVQRSVARDTSLFARIGN